MAIDSNLPEDLIPDILRRLPVKTLIRFKSVCKSWCALTKNPNFIKSHLATTTSTSSNNHHSLLCLNKSQGHELVHIRIDSTQTNPSIEYISHQIPKTYNDHRSKGVVSLNGVVCLSGGSYPYHYIVLWNPAMKLVKPIPNPPNDSQPSGWSGKEIYEMLFAMCFDESTNDFKIIRIVRYQLQSDVLASRYYSRIEIYSCNANVWKQIADGIDGATGNNGAIVKGTPYWCFSNIASSRTEPCILGLDVNNEVLNKVPLPDEVTSFAYVDAYSSFCVINWMDSLAVWVHCSSSEATVCEVILFILDETSGSWSKKYVLIPTLENNLSVWPKFCRQPRRILLCFENGDLLVANISGMLFLLHLKTYKLMDLEGRSDVTSYTESMFYVEGMKQLKKEEDKLEEEDNKKKKISNRGQKRTLTLRDHLGDISFNFAG